MSSSQARTPKPKGMPPYPRTPEEKKRDAIDTIYFTERSLIGGDFTYYSENIKAKLELKKLCPDS